ncbi:MAG: thiamine ABC transporter substrate-binding protein [Chloroflexi bacterium]|nr:thiamine ABC transporter substrate-binding protein [Chloroflexota bacterium]MCA2000976.1 thiamine ABC transporter substrate-binding protein [Chloroflexota bacterium]
MKRLTFTFLFVALLLASCAPTSTPAPVEPQTVTVVTHDSFAIGEETIKAFEMENNAKVVFLQGGDAGSLLNQAILTKDAPLADVLFGVDNTFLSRALEADIFEPYQSPALADIPDEFKLDPSNRALPVDYGDVCLNYDKKYFSDNNLAVPQSFEDLAKPEYKDLLVVENPATSSPGLAFLLATRAHFGDGYLDYWKSLKENGVVVVDGWETAYYTNFSASSGKGPQPMVVSYASSPAAEVFFASEPMEESPTASIAAEGMCFRQIEFVGVFKNGKNKPLAQKFVDFTLSRKFQEDMPLNMFVYPVNQKAQLPEVFVKYADVVQSPASISADEIAANRDRWIEAWSETMK